jgi:hypothetical protein
VAMPEKVVQIIKLRNNVKKIGIIAIQERLTTIRLPP